MKNKSRYMIFPIAALALTGIVVFGVQSGTIKNLERTVKTLKEIQGELIEKNASMQYTIDNFSCPVAEPTENTRIDIPITGVEKIPNEVFRNVAKQYPDIDAGFAYANFLLETGHGKSEAWVEHNNPAGIIKLDGSGEYQHYATEEEGLHAMFTLLQYYSSNCKNTPTLLREIWAEEPQTTEVVKIWKEIHNG